MHDLYPFLNTMDRAEMSSAPPCPVILDCCQPVTTDLVDKALDRCWATTSSLVPCPAWLIKASRPVTTEWATTIINGSLQEGKVPLALKETLIRPIRKKLSLAADDIGNYRPVTNVSFLSKVVERVVNHPESACSAMGRYISSTLCFALLLADQLQALLDETNVLDPFQSGFRPCHGTETALVALFDDLLRPTGA